MAMLAREGEGGADAIGFGIEIEQGRELRLAAGPTVTDDDDRKGSLLRAAALPSLRKAGILTKLG